MNAGMNQAMNHGMNHGMNRPGNHAAGMTGMQCVRSRGRIIGAVNGRGSTATARVSRGAARGHPVRGGFNGSVI
ncbi:hypothetical protein SAMN05216251_12452 [Actinacidiphila alni]|uniref:Uncharacterized protein n=1 Tax=Actinacidiphila alni TaxID=380248 RepID=A0A1I2KPJ3_9ACTN|nr:hypothetical protein [Actinacidiphila alni]SFF68443.1 hypothetical protein SAMN05216251_12452 [Actinacidiphila alni]